MRTRPHLLLTMAALLAAIPLGFLACTQNPSSSSAGGAGAPHEPTIKDLYKGHFLIGTSGDVPGGFSDQELALVKENFNIITPENYLKPAPVHPLENVWAFTRPDALVKWCTDNGVAIHGHTLMWHAQTNGWFFEGGNKEVVTQRLKDHITTLVGRYKGKIHSWDVVNEAINDGGGGGGGPGENLRNSQWLQILGPDFLTIAFKFAHEADPDAKLYYNDYNIESGGKHQNSMALLRRLIRDGAPISGVGIQGHWSTSGINYNALDQAISDYASLGLKVSISELDITIAGASGGQIGGPGGGPGGGGGRGRGRGAAPATGPATGPGAFLMDADGLFFAQAAPGRGGPGRGGPGRGGMAAPANPADTISATVTDLSGDEQSKLAALTTDISAKISQWQSSSLAALLTMQPQYQPGQVAYQHELEEYNAEQAKQAGLRDDLINDAEARLNAILTPAQAEKWETARLNTQFTAQFGALNVTDEQKAKVDPIVSATAKKLAAAKDQAAIASAKADFTKQVLRVLDDAQITQYQALTNPAPAGRGAGRGGGGGGGGAASAAGLKAQADAYARIFAIFEKHRNDMDRITFWGLNDARSWRAGQHPLIFDENNQRKPDYQAIMDVLLHPAATVPGTAP